MHPLYIHLTGPFARRATAAASLLLYLPAAEAHAQMLAAVQLPAPQQPAAARTVQLKELLGQWEKQYNTTIVYKTDLVRDKTAVVQTETGNLEQMLANVLQQVGLGFQKLRADYYVVVKSAPSNASASKAVPISGHVTQANGVALPGVTVVVKGTTTGISTDANGNFSLEVPEGATLTFSFVGYVTQEVAVNGQTTLNITPGFRMTAGWYWS